MKSFYAFLSIVAIVMTCGPGTAAPGGPVTDHISTLSVDSQILDETREVYVALPRGYDESDARYPVVYVLDADWHFTTAVAATRFLAETSYISAHRMPPVILVGIVNHDRNEDDTPTRCVSQHGMSFPTSGGADDFLVFMRDELIPEIDRRYRTHPYRVLCGWSLGGLLTTYALVEHPDIFGGHIAISPSLWWDDRRLVDRAVELAASGERRNRDLVLTIGTAEEGGLCYNAVHTLVERWEERSPAGLNLSFIEIPDEDHNHSPYKAYFDGFRALFADWFYPEAAFDAGLDSLRQHYAVLSRRRGYTITVPGHMYAAMARRYLAEDRPDDAVAVVEAQCAASAQSAMAYFQLGEICRKVQYNERALDAYSRALQLERASSAPDTVFINWVENVVAGLDEGE